MRCDVCVTPTKEALDKSDAGLLNIKVYHVCKGVPLRIVLMIDMLRV